MSTAGEGGIESGTGFRWGRVSKCEKLLGQKTNVCLNLSRYVSDVPALRVSMQSEVTLSSSLLRSRFILETGEMECD